MLAKGCIMVTFTVLGLESCCLVQTKGKKIAKKIA